MFPTILIAHRHDGGTRFRAFTITVYCEEENLETAFETATSAAANADGVIMANCSQTARVPNGMELDDLEEIVAS